MIIIIQSTFSCQAVTCCHVPTISFPNVYAEFVHEQHSRKEIVLKTKESFRFEDGGYSGRPMLHCKPFPLQTSQSEEEYRFLVSQLDLFGKICTVSEIFNPAMCSCSGFGGEYKCN